MITTIKFTDISIPSHHYHFFFFVVLTFKTNLLNNFHVYNTVLVIIVTMLYISSLELIDINLTAGSL